MDRTEDDSPAARLLQEEFRAPGVPFIALFDSAGRYLPELALPVLKNPTNVSVFLETLRKVR